MKQLEVFGKVNGSGWIKCRCPFGIHADRNPSASLNVSEGIVHCFTCNMTVSIDELNNNYGYNVDIKSMSSDIDNALSLAGDKDCYEELFKTVTYENADGDVIAYVNSRGVNSEVANKYGIRFSKNAVYFPFTSKGTVVPSGYQKRLINTKAMNKYIACGSLPTLWPDVGLFPPKNEFVILTEGVFGAINVRNFGYDGYAVIGANGKKAFSVVMLLSNFVSPNNIVIAFDNDMAGKRASKHYKNFGCLITEGGEVDEMSKSELRELIKRAKLDY